MRWLHTSSDTVRLANNHTHNDPVPYTWNGTHYTHTKRTILKGEEMNNCECCGRVAGEDELRVVVVDPDEVIFAPGEDQLAWGCEQCQKTHETL